MRVSRTLMCALCLVSTVLLMSSAVFADDGNLTRLSAEFQNDTSVGAAELATNAAPLPGGAGGTVTYDKVLKVGEDINVIYLHFEGQADVHNGSALALTATLTQDALAPVVIQPAAGGGNGSAGPSGWETVLKLPAPTASTNCNDGGGGTADCHDNGIALSGCWRLQKVTGEGPKTVEIQIKLADFKGGDGNVAFYERAFIVIDGQHDNDGTLCTGVGRGKH